MGSSVKKLIRTDISDSCLSGVCGGVAQYFGINSTVVRVGTVVLMIITNAFVIAIAYCVACVVMSSENYTPVGF